MIKIAKKKKIRFKKINKRPFKSKENAQYTAQSWRKGGFYARVKKAKKGYNIYKSTNAKRKNKVKI